MRDALEACLRSGHRCEYSCMRDKIKEATTPSFWRGGPGAWEWEGTVDAHCCLLPPHPRSGHPFLAYVSNCSLHLGSGVNLPGWEGHRKGTFFFLLGPSLMQDCKSTALTLL